MIIRETPDQFVLIEQHEHGRLSGDIARQLNPMILNEQDPYAAEVIGAVYEHDRGWIALDKVPSWNPESGAPYTFEDYPLAPKLDAYREGLREIEEQSLYAALICSLHYASFTHQAHTPEFKAFLAEEVSRQERLRTRLGLSEQDETVYKHFRLLQLCDDLSLYVCMNEPGAAKDQEHPWFRDGFPNTEVLSPDGDRLFSAEWKNIDTVAVHPAAFPVPFAISIRGKAVPKQLIERAGIEKAYAQTEAFVQSFIME